MCGFFCDFMADYDLNAPVATTQAQKAATGTLLAGQDARTGDFLGRYTGAINSQPSTSAIASRIGDELGLPTLQANARSLNTTLFNLPTTYSKATTGFDVNANQLARIVGQKQSELAPAAGLATQNALDAEKSINTRLGYETRDQDRALLPYQSEQTLLADRLARETSLYSQDNENELNAIISKMQAGIQISEAEKSRAQQLAMAEKEYQNQLSLQKQSQSFTSDENRKNRLVQLAGAF